MMPPLSPNQIGENKCLKFNDGQNQSQESGPWAESWESLELCVLGVQVDHVFLDMGTLLIC